MDLHDHPETPVNLCLCGLVDGFEVQDQPEDAGPNTSDGMPRNSWCLQDDADSDAGGSTWPRTTAYCSGGRGKEGGPHAKGKRVVEGSAGRVSH